MLSVPSMRYMSTALRGRQGGLMGFDARRMRRTEHVALMCDPAMDKVVCTSRCIIVNDSLASSPFAAVCYEDAEGEGRKKAGN
jgi:hypothetical protein